LFFYVFLNPRMRIKGSSQKVYPRIIEKDFEY
jgi:hypothetical protein